MRRELPRRELDERTAAVVAVVRAELCILVTAYARLLDAHGHTPGTGTHCALLRSVFEHIDANYRRPIALAEVAKAVGRSRAYLTGLVRRETGRTVGDWIAERRMAEARRLLHGTEREVGAIAEAVSFIAAGHLIRLFRRRHAPATKAARADLTVAEEFATLRERAWERLSAIIH